MILSTLWSFAKFLEVDTEVALVCNSTIISCYSLMVLLSSLTSTSTFLHWHLLLPNHPDDQLDYSLITRIPSLLLALLSWLFCLVVFTARPIEDFLIKDENLNLPSPSNWSCDVFQLLSLLFSICPLLAYWKFCVFLDENQANVIFAGSLGIHFIAFAVCRPYELLLFDSRNASIEMVKDGAMACLVCVHLPALTRAILTFKNEGNYQGIIGRALLLWLGTMWAHRLDVEKSRRSHRRSILEKDSAKSTAVSNIQHQRRSIRYSNPYNNHDDNKIGYHMEESAIETVQRMKRQGLPNAHRLVHYYNRDHKLWYVGNSKYN